MFGVPRLFTIYTAKFAHALAIRCGSEAPSNIVQGIGLLGAGSHLVDGGAVTGENKSAEAILCEADIGMAAGRHFKRVAGYSTGLVLFGLQISAGRSNTSI